MECERVNEEEKQIETALSRQQHPKVLFILSINICLYSFFFIESTSRYWFIVFFLSFSAFYMILEWRQRRPYSLGTCRWRRRASLCSANESTQGSNTIHSKGRASSFHSSCLLFPNNKFLSFEGRKWFLNRWVPTFTFIQVFFSFSPALTRPRLSFLSHLLFIWISMFTRVKLFRSHSVSETRRR